MRKLFACITVLGMLAAMTACGNDDNSVSRAEKTTSSVTETKAEETTEKAAEKVTEKAAEKVTEATEKAAETEETEAETHESGEEELVITEDEMKGPAVTLMDCMTRLWKLFAGDMTLDESDTIEVDGTTFARVIDFGFFGDYNVEKLKAFIDITCIDHVRDELYAEIDSKIIEKDGNLYAYNPARGYNIFRTEEGVTLSDITSNSFTATCNASDQMTGTGSAHFVLVNGIFLMDHYEFN